MENIEDDELIDLSLFRTIKHTTNSKQTEKKNTVAFLSAIISRVTRDPMGKMQTKKSKKITMLPWLMWNSWTEMQEFETQVSQKSGSFH